MKTRKTFFLSFSFLCLGFIPISAMGQSLPHTFSANTAAKASEVNENFTYLLERFGTRKTTVNCYSGESITTALKNYNHIVISGICTENLSLDATILPHRLVILEGSSSSSDGISASDTSKAVVEIFNGSITFKVTNLQFKNGSSGITAYRGPKVLLENVTIKDNTGHGMDIWSTSFGKIKNSTIKNNGGVGILAGYSSVTIIEENTISGHTTSSSIKILRSSSAYIYDNTITNGKALEVTGSSSAEIKNNNIIGTSGNNAVEINHGSSATIKSNTIQSAYNGISVNESSFAVLRNNSVKYNSKNGLQVDHNASVSLAEGNTFSNNAERGMGAWLGGSINMWCGSQLTSATTISSNTKGAIDISKGGLASLCNLTLSSPTRGISAGKGAVLDMQNITITNSQKEGVNLWGATANIDNATITGSTQTGIRVGGGGMLEIKNSTISGSTKHGIKAELGATLNMSYVSITNNQNDGVSLWGAKVVIGNSTITGNNEGIRINNGFLEIYNSTISGSTINAITSHQQSAINLGGGVIIENNGYGIDVHNSTLFKYGTESTSYIRNNTGYEIAATMSSIGLNTVTVGGTSGNNEIHLNMGSNLRIGTGTSITGTISCDGSLNTGKFIDDTITLNPTTSGC
jgi:parallel beta-helix repeat protein